MRLNHVLPACALTTVLVVVCLSPVSASPPVSLTGSCVDGGGRTWQSKAVWGSEYTDSAGTRRVSVDYAGWTTNGGAVPTDSVVRTYDGAGKRLQELKWTGRVDYRGGKTWRSTNPLNPPSAPGKARVTVTLGIDGDGKSNCTRTFVQPAAPKAASPSVAPAASGWWSADLSGVPVGSMACHRDTNTATATALKRQWDYWDNCGGSVVDPATAGIPNPPGGTQRVVKWQKPLGSDQVYQKLNRTFTKDNWPQGSSAKVALTGSPADVSGIYSAYLYIPSSDFVLNPSHGWTQFLQVKESYTDANGKWHQDPIWAMGVNNFSRQSVGGGLWPTTTTPSSSATTRTAG